MNYAQRWTMAVALKRAYPRPETGAADPAAAVPPPPVFVPVSDGMSLTKASYFSLGGLVIGLGVGYLMWKGRGR